MLTDPWYKETLRVSALGVSLKLAVPHDVFSTVKIDEGTHLLLGALPGRAPLAVLDVGCGYGALGLPVAAKFRDAHVDLIDRDLLAVEWSRANAESNGLANVKAQGSLGFQNFPPSTLYDWILCNVPARIGRPFIEHLLLAGRARLSSEGELRVVVIRDLAPLMEEIRVGLDLPLREEVRGPRHSVFSLPASSAPLLPLLVPDDLYLRDQVEISGIRLDRPFDLGGDDPRRLQSGLPVILDALPRRLEAPPGKPPRRVLTWRLGYGALALTAAARWPQADFTAIDRDLLATGFTRRNAEKTGIRADRLMIREIAHFPNAIRPGETFDLAMGELSPSAGEAVAIAEIESVKKALAPGGEAYLLCLDKIERDWVRKLAERRKLSIYRVINREGFTVLRLT